MALTRAEEQLYIISGMNIGKEDKLPNNLSSFFIEFLQNNFKKEQLEYDFGNNEKKSATKVEISNALLIPQVLETLNPINIKIAQKESLMWNTKQAKAIEYGNVIHEILSFIKTKKDIKVALKKAMELGLIKETDEKLIHETILDIVTHPQLELFFTEDSKILNEQTIIQKERGLLKPDRIVLNQYKEVYLLDYKTGLHQSKYVSQLENYKNAIEEIGLKVVKMAIVYIGESLEIVTL